MEDLASSSRSDLTLREGNHGHGVAVGSRELDLVPAGTVDPDHSSHIVFHERMIREVTSKHHHIVFVVSREPSARRPALRPGKAFPAQRDQDAATSRKPRRTTPIKRPRHRNRSPLDRYATSMSLESLPPWGRYPGHAGQMRANFDSAWAADVRATTRDLDRGSPGTGHEAMEQVSR